MRNVTKKITSLFFIMLGFLPMLFVLFITIKKQDIRHRMKKELQHQHLQVVVLPEKEVTWMDKHEIWVNNYMFDIHTKKLENGIYTFTGLYDEDETILVELERNAAGKNNDQNKLLATFFKCLLVFFNQPAEILTLALLHEHNISFITKSLLNPFKEILTPPPQVCC